MARAGDSGRAPVLLWSRPWLPRRSAVPPHPAAQRARWPALHPQADGSHPCRSSPSVSPDFWRKGFLSDWQADGKRKQAALQPHQFYLRIEATVWRQPRSRRHRQWVGAGVCMQT